PEQRVFRSLHGTAYAAWLDDHPAAADLVASSFRPRSGKRPGWLADYLCHPVAVPEPTIHDELALLSRITDDRMRADLLETTGRPLTPSLLEPGLTATVLDLVRWIWTHTLESDWPRRERLLRADIVG
ncbi:hypothetical protein, partial [Raoultella terrigena]|uniref:hypothetical protein n=1 Tax=Raoultella terrigena TaxID=577 RepID=UPI001C702513